MGSRRPSLKTHAELPSCESLSDSSGPSTLTNDPLSLWEWTVPDEGYCTGSTAPGEVPVMVDSARKELEGPICMEMMPPARIWQCKLFFAHRAIQCQSSEETLPLNG